MTKTLIKTHKKLELIDEIIIDEIIFPSYEEPHTTIKYPNFNCIGNYLKNTILKKYKNSKDINPNKMINIEIDAIPLSNSYRARIYQRK